MIQKSNDHCGSQTESSMERNVRSIQSMASMLSIVECFQTKPSPSIPYLSRCWTIGVRVSQYQS